MPDLGEVLQATLGDVYTIERELGGGGMARVFLAHEDGLHRDVVIKLLPPNVGEGVSLDRFKREIHVSAMLQHPHIVPVLAAGEVLGQPYYVMPFVAGESLRARLDRSTVPLSEAIGMLWDVARALAYAHEHGVIHRDIKPDNILLSSGSAVVADFGISKAIDSARSRMPDTALTREGTSIGTPAYMAPEQAAADPATDHRADIYAFGCVAYHLLAGQPPFMYDTAHALLKAHMVEAPRPIGEVAPDVPPALARLVMACLDKDPSGRPNAADVKRFFEEHSAAGARESGHREWMTRAVVGYASACVVLAVAVRGLSNVTDLPDWAVPATLVLLVVGTPLTLALGRRHARSLGAATFAAFAGAVGGSMTLRAYGVGPFASLLSAGRLAAHERLLVADFHVSGADTALGRVLSEAVRAGLAQSNAVTVVPISTVASGLRRMERTATSALDEEVARELAQRDGIKAVVSGDIAAVGSGFVMTLRVRDAATRDVLVTFSETAENPARILPALNRLTRKLRGAIGESLRLVRASPPLEQVTTPSLEALRTYTRGVYALDVEVDYTKAIGLLRQAITADSAFGMAYRKLAAAYNNGGYPVALRRDAARRAFALCDRLTERECLLAEAYYMNLEANRRAAADAYERLLGLDSLDFGALINLGLIEYERRRFNRAELLWRRAAASPGAPPIAYDNVKWALLGQGKVREADSVTTLVKTKFPDRPTDADEAYSQYMRGRIDSAAASFERLLARGPDALRARALTSLAGLAQLRGRLREAERLVIEARKIDSARGLPVNWMDDSMNLASIDVYSRGDAHHAVSRLDGVMRGAGANRPWLDLVTLYGRTGRADRARLTLAKYDSVTTDSAIVKRNLARREVALAEIALAEAHADSAIAHFARSDQLEDGPSNACGICTYARLARAFDAAGARDSAIAYYTLYLKTPYGLRTDEDPLYLPGTYIRLGELLEDRGEADEALKYYGRFVDLWKVADPEMQSRVVEIRRRIAGLSRNSRGEKP